MVDHNAIKCVVIGDGTVGSKFFFYTPFYFSFVLLSYLLIGTVFSFARDLSPPNLLYKSISHSVRADSFWQLCSGPEHRRQSLHFSFVWHG